MLIPAGRAHDRVTDRATEAGLYRARDVPSTKPVPTNVLRSWVIEVVTAGSIPSSDARVTVDGGIPDHGHGLPTRSQVTFGAKRSYDVLSVEPEPDLSFPKPWNSPNSAFCRVSAHC